MSYEIKKVLNEDGMSIKIGIYASKNNAINNCLPGYSVYDKNTGEVIYSNTTPVENRKHEKENYKEMWGKLKDNIKERVDTLADYDNDLSKDFYTAYKIILNVMKEFESEE